MQFRTIRTTLDHEGEVTRIRDLTPRSRGLWFYRSCNNPLRSFSLSSVPDYL